MNKKMQVADITLNERGLRFVVVRDYNKKVNAYTVKQKWYDLGWHEKTMVHYDDMKSCLHFIAAYA